MPEIAGSDATIRQCRAFTRYLTGSDPSPYVVRKYGEMAPRADAIDKTAPAIDLELLKWASRGGVSTRIADSYARIFRPGGLLRRRLVLLCAILENSPEAHRHFTSGGESVSRYAYGRVGFALASFATALGIGLLLFGPIQLFARLSGRETQR